MSVREYVGARYVPVFADPLEWNSANTYEPLTIVLYQGNSYTSRQAVPAGIAITNTAYWAQTGNYNAQIEQYRQEVQALDTEIDNLLPVSIGNGGTGATDAAGARAAIDAAQSNGATNTLYDAELAIAENAADIADLQEFATIGPAIFAEKNAMSVLQGGGTIGNSSLVRMRRLFGGKAVHFEANISISNFTSNNYHKIQINIVPPFTGVYNVSGWVTLHPKATPLESIILEFNPTFITMNNKFDTSGLGGTDTFVRFSASGIILKD